MKQLGVFIGLGVLAAVFVVIGLTMVLRGDHSWPAWLILIVGILGVILAIALSARSLTKPTSPGRG